ncbi:MAG: zinc-dependent metalloprotease [Dermatophilaceae bacterium]
MSDRGGPEPAPDEPDRPEDAPSGEGWSGAVDRPDPGSPGPAPMGFGGSSAGSSGGSSQSGPASGGGTGTPGFDELLRALGQMVGGSGGTPDLSGLLKDVLGEDVTLPPEVTQMLTALTADPSSNPMAAMLRQQLGALFGTQSPQQRLDNARDIARKVLAVRGDRVVSDAERRELEDAVHVAQLWVDPVTSFGSSGAVGAAWSGADWVEATMPTWYKLVEPIAEGVTHAASEALGKQVDSLGSLGMPDALGGLAGQVGPALEQLSAGLFAAQTGQAVGTLAADVLSATEVGLPLVAPGTVALLPAQVAQFGEGLGVDATQVRLYLAVREVARVRLFAEVPWLGSQLEAAVRDYGRHISVDTDAIEAAVRSIDFGDLSSLQNAFSQAQLFAQSTTPAQQAALTRLEATLALVEGWVDLVTDQAVAPHLPQAEALGEAVRRRRAGGPAQKVFASLVGLELRPRRLKDARNLWAALEQAGGVAMRDASWQQPDLAPTAADLDDPLGYTERRTTPPVRDALDAELDALLSGGSEGDAGGSGGSGGSQGEAGEARGCEGEAGGSEGEAGSAEPD